MTSSVGGIHFGVSVDASGIASELRREVSRALTAEQQRLNRTPLTVPVDIDISSALARAQQRIRASRMSVAVGVEVDIADALRRAQQRISASRMTINVGVDLDIDAALARAEQRARTSNTEIRVRVVPDMGRFAEIVTAQLAIMQATHNWSITVPIDLDTAGALAQARAAREALEAIFRDSIRQNVDVNVDRDSGRNAGSLRSSLMGLGATAGTISAVAAAIAGIGGAAGLALGAVGGLAAGLAALGPVALGIGAAVATGIQGMGDAFSALSAASDNTASEAQAQAQAIESAQQQVASATNSAISAQESLTSAQKDAARAAKDVGDAYKQAERDLRNYQLTADEAHLSEIEAAFALEDAQKAVLEARDPDQHERAVLRVRQAELRLLRAQDATREAVEARNDAEEKGIENSDAVTEARERQADADQRVTQAERSLAQANAAVAQAQQAVTDAQNKALPSTQKLNDALAALSPNAREFVLAAQAAKPAWEEFTEAIQDNLFENLAGELTETANVVLPAIQDSLGGVASELSATAVQFANFLQSARGIELLNSSFESATNFIRGLRSGTGELTQGWIDFVAVSAPAMEGFGRSIAGIGEGIGRALSAARESGALQEIFAIFNGPGEGEGSFWETFTTTLLELARVVLPVVQPLMAALGQALQDLAPALGQLGAVFGNSLSAILPGLSDLISSLATGLVPVMPVLVGLFNSLFAAIEPVIPELARITQIVGTALINVIDALAPALGPLVTAFADLLQAISPLVTLIATNLAVVIEALAPALSTLFVALTPVIQQFAEGMIPVVREIAPILADVAMQLGTAMAEALNRLMPYLPGLIQAFSDLVLAVVPILPELLDLALVVLPPLTDAMVLLAPIIVEQANAFTYLIETVINGMVIPALDWMEQRWTDVFETIDGIVSWVEETVFPKLGTALDRVKGWFSGAIDFIRDKWGELGDIAAVPVNFVIETVWNNGLLKAWSSIDDLLGGVLPDAGPIAPIPRRATGGSIGYTHGGIGNGTRDDILTWLSNNEHVVTSAEVIAAGGHNILYAIRDMIARGIPFTWDNGRIISELGRDNLNRYGAQVARQGLGNVPPEGLFDQLANVPIPRFRTGGQVFPWMHQLKAGHDFARAQNGKPYQWAGPTGPGSSFDCSGFMGSIAAAILGQNVWQRYWATSSFAGYPSVGPQGFTKNLTQGSGFAIGVTDDPGGPGGGHTAGELRGIPELGIPAARVESGGALGDVHYGRGTDPNSFASLYGLPIGANGFFQPAPGGSQNGPSTADQDSFLRRTIERIVNTVTDPIRDTMSRVIGDPPPSVRAIPGAALSATQRALIDAASNAVGGLGGLLGGAWQKAQDIGDRVLDFVNPFDNGGLANGVGFMPKNVIAPERVLSPEQTKLFEALVRALQGIAGASGQAANRVVVDLSQASIEALSQPSSLRSQEDIADSIDIMGRSQSSLAEEQARADEEQRELLLTVVSRLGGDVLGPIMASAVDAGIGVLDGWLGALGEDVVTAVNGTTSAVNNLDTSGYRVPGDPGFNAPPFGAPGSAFDFASAASDAVVQVANTARQVFEQVGQDIAREAFAQTPSRVSESRGRLGTDISGGYLVDLIVRLTGVEIEILDLLENTYKEILSFREGSFNAFEASGELVSDTAALVQRNQSSMELQARESERIQKALIKAVLKYLIVNVLLPIITAILGAMITLATTAIGAAIGAAIPVIGPLIGAAVGAAIGAALAGLATVFTSVLAIGAGAALDAFDEGGVAHGVGMMPKNTIAPERVLSPRQTQAFESLIPVLDRMTGGDGGNRTIQIGSMNINGRDPAQKTADDLLSLLNG